MSEGIDGTVNRHYLGFNSKGVRQMASKFTKGDRVAVLRSWNNKGTVTIRRAIVEAFGPKICRLRDPLTGEMFKAAYSTRPNNSGMVLETMAIFNGCIVIADCCSAELELTAIYHGEKIIEGNIAYYEDILERRTDASSGYITAITKDRDELRSCKAAVRWHHDREAA